LWRTAASLWIEIMRRIVMVAIAGVGLAGCGSLSMPGLDVFKPAPVEGILRLESKPAGAEARASTGQACRTPCSVKIPIGEGFSVTFSLDKHQPQTVAVQVLQINTDAPLEEGAPSPAFDPNPIYVELQLAKPPPRKPAVKRSTAPTPRTSPGGAQPTSPSSSAFPSPQQQPSSSSAFPPPPSR
jgi:hypothetical protein